MTPELKAKWIAALRSGDYKQGEGQLRKGDKYCCLGVLCVVSGITIEGEGEQVAGGYEPICRLIEDRGDWLTQTLWRKNDHGEPFADIADWIEANL